MSSTRSDVNYHGKAGPGLYDHESVSIAMRNLQTPFNSLIMAAQDNPADSIVQGIRCKKRDATRAIEQAGELGPGDLIVVPRNELQLHRHQCRARIRQKRIVIPGYINRAKFPTIQSIGREYKHCSVGNLDFHLHTG